MTLKRIIEPIRRVPYAVKRRFGRAVYAVRDVVQVDIALFFLAGERLRLWKLRRVAQGKSAAPVSIAGLERFVKWSCILVTSIDMVCAAYKLALWRGWIIP